MEIEILGKGCPRCHDVEKRTKEVLAELHLSADVQMIKDIKKMASYGVVATPAVIVNGQIKSSGRVPSLSELKECIEKENQKKKSK